MPTSTTVNDLKINKLTKAQYDAAVQAGTIGENELSVITDLDASPQVDVLPTADANSLGKIYQYIGATDSNYTNGYFYKCTSTGTAPDPIVYSWTRVDVQPAPTISYPVTSVNSKTGDVVLDADDVLPTQTSQSGKFLTTNGTTASWKELTTSPSTTPTLVAANWSSNTQTINVTGVTASNLVLVSPTPVSAEDYANAGVLCTAQGNGTLTFTCDTTPSVDLTVNVVCF